MGSEKILKSIQSKEYKNDGLIFTPINEPYPKECRWSKLFKWKPAHLNTIDFYAIKKIDSNIWELYVKSAVKTDPKRGSETELSLFDISKLIPDTLPSEVPTYETQISSEMIDPSTNEPYQSGTVIEFRWSLSENRFVPLRTRWDKTFNPRKHGNFSTVAIDIWNNIHNPVNKEDITSTKLKTVKADQFETMRKFHNKIKEDLYKRFVSNTNHLLELCSGRGGDIHKWVNNNVKNVTGYDLSESAITECNRRLQQTKSSTRTEFYQLDLTSPTALDIIKQHQRAQFDNVCCHFGVHYFFKDQTAFQNLISILRDTLNNNGYFIVTFMDNAQIDALFKSDDNDTISSEDTESREMHYILNRQPTKFNFGQRLRIVLNGNTNNFLTEGSNEYIINYKYFCEIMEQSGFKLIETKLFQEIYNSMNMTMENYEKDISFLNRYCVFQKLQSNDVQIEVPKREIAFKEPFQYNMIDLHKYDLSVYKLTTKYDLINLVNCIEYKYYKNTIENGTLVTFQDIQDTFQEAKIFPFCPVYVENPFVETSYQEDTTSLYFTYHKHTIEKKNENGDVEDQIYDNWYVLLHKNNLSFKKSQLHFNQEV